MIEDQDKDAQKTLGILEEYANKLQAQARGETDSCAAWQGGAPRFPAADVQVGGGEIVVRLHVQCVPRDDVRVRVQDRVLIVSGECVPSAEGSFCQRESWVGPFYRAIHLPPRADTSTWREEFHDGTLTITFNAKE